MKRDFGASLVVTMVLFCHTVCAQTLTVWDFKYGGSDSAALVLKDLDTLFETIHPGVKIKHVGQPGVTYYQLIKQAAEADKTPDIAMFHADGNLRQFGSLLVSLDKDISDIRAQFTPSSLIAVSIPQKNGREIKLLPMTEQGFGIYYNKIVFKRAGLDPSKPPKSAAEFLLACKRLKAAGIVPIVAGKDYSIDFLLRALAANIIGPSRATLDHDDVFSSPEFAEAATFVKVLMKNGYIEKAGLTRPYFPDGIDAFRSSGGGLFIGLLSDVGNWKTFSDSLGINNVGYFPVVNLPGARYKDQQAAQPAGIGYGIFRATKELKLSLEYVKFLSTGTGAARFATASGALSPNMMIDVAENPYPLLATVIAYLRSGFSVDFVTLGQSSFEEQLIRLDEQFFVANAISLDDYLTKVKKAFHDQ